MAAVSTFQRWMGVSSQVPGPHVFGLQSRLSHSKQKLYSPPPLVHYLVSGLLGRLQGSFNPYLGNPIPDQLPLLSAAFTTGQGGSIWRFLMAGLLLPLDCGGGLQLLPTLALTLNPRP